MEGFPLSTPDGYFAIDTETTGLDPWASGCRPFFISLCNADGDTAWVRFSVNPRTRDVVPFQEGLDALQNLLGDSSLLKVMHNTAFDYRMLSMLGLEIHGRIWDTLIGMHVINPDEMNYGLKYLSKRHLKIDDGDQKELLDAVRKVRTKIRSLKKAGSSDPLALWAPAPDDVTNGKDASAADYWMATHDLCVKYAVTDAVRTAMLYEMQKKELATEKGLTTVFDMEMELMAPLRRMEDRGIRIDLQRTEELRAEYQAIAEAAMVDLASRGLGELNPKSPKQMCAHFFGTLDHKPKVFSTNDDGDYIACVHCAEKQVGKDGKELRRETHTKTGKKVMRVVKRSEGCKICNFTGHNPKCDGEYLSKLAWKFNPATDRLEKSDEDAYQILRYDGAKHMLVNFFEPYLLLADEDPFNPGGHRLHPNYKQCGPGTGRLACERPNLMQVASDDTPRKYNDIPYKCREIFFARPGHVMYMPDYSQIEVWIFAALAKDKVMLDTLMSGKDFHGTIAATVWASEFDLDEALRCKNIPHSELNSKEKHNLDQYVKYRKRSKLLMFSTLYGGGDDVKAGLLGSTREEAARFTAEYYQRLPGIPRFMKESINEIRERGYVTTPFGRKFRIPKNLAYKATNYRIQGSAAGVMKRSLIRVGELATTNFRYVGRMHPLLNIHDEHAIEAHKSIHNERTMRDIITAMQGDDHLLLNLPVPLPVGMKYSTSTWAEMREIKGL
jgi:DNA polymerase I-like protein with 3'-5' exonuclease and polymerase domains